MDIASFSHKDTTFSTLVDFPASRFTLFYPHLHFPLIIQCPFRIVALNSYLPHLNHTSDSEVLLGWSVPSSAWHQRPTKDWLQPTPPVLSPATPSLMRGSKLPAVPPNHQATSCLHACASIWNALSPCPRAHLCYSSRFFRCESTFPTPPQL